MQIAMIDRSLNKSGTYDGSDALFARDWNASLAHRIMVAHAANARQGTRKQKTRAEVKHTTKRLYRQKGTGRARAGMSTSPIRRGGGRAFPASPVDNLRKELNRKEFRAGMATLLSQLVREDRLFIAEELGCDEVKTKNCVSMLNKFGGKGKVLFVDTEFDEKFALSMRNLFKIKLVEVPSLIATDLVHSTEVVISKRAADKFAGMWA